MKRVIKWLLAIFAVLIVALVSWNFFSAEKVPPAQTELGPEEPVGTVTTRGGRNFYSNDKFKFQLAYPLGWKIENNSFETGYFQLYNFENDYLVNKTFGPGENKIEANVVENNGWSPSDVFNPVSTKITNVEIAGKTFQKLEEELTGGSRYVRYLIQVPDSKKYLSVAISGDPANFSILENILATLEWK